MRISKKFAGTNCLGNRVYLRYLRRPHAPAEFEAEARTLAALEARVLTAPEAASVPAGAEEEEKRESPPSNLATADEVSALLRAL